MSLKVLVIDDHPLVLKGVIAALQTLPGHTTVLCARDGEQGLKLVQQHAELDLVLLDLALPGADRANGGYDMITRLHERWPALPVLVVSALEDPQNVELALRRGAKGFVPKSAGSETLLNAIQDVLAGVVSVPRSVDIRAYGASDAPGPDVGKLTRRQLQVLKAVCQGKTNRQAAEELGLAEKTVKAHITGVFKALQVVTRTQAVLIARRLGMMPR